MSDSIMIKSEDFMINNSGYDFIDLCSAITAGFYVLVHTTSNIIHMQCGHICPD